MHQDASSASESGRNWPLSFATMAAVRRRSLAAGEITDKAYVNQRVALKHRAELAERLYCNEASADVVRV